MSYLCIDNNIVDVVGLCDPTKITFAQTPPLNDRNWTEISIPEMLYIPCQKPDIEHIDKLFINAEITCKKVIKTPASNTASAEGLFLKGRKLIVEGILHQKVIYTALVPNQKVHAAHFNIPFSTFIVLPQGSIDEKFCVDVCIEDVFIKALSRRQIFKNVTLFLRAVPL